MTRSPLPFASLLVLAAWTLLPERTQAQQFVRNTTDIPASTGYTENVDFADIDLDGDWDAAFAEGGDFGNQQNRLWQNQGGAQGGAIGFFLNVTATQAPAVTDTSRDVEFVDFDGDSDPDLFVSNTVQITSSNNSNRWWANLGGLQAGTVGFYQDQTSARWIGLGGAGSSIAPAMLGGNGGYMDFSCDSDFGDLDGDGDLDLVQSTYGGSFGGQVPTRIFLNDGSGFFSEFNPSGFQLPGQNISNGNPGLWCEGLQQANTLDTTGVSCDIASSALDVELGDIDGDLDLDLLHGARQEVPRMFENRLQENGGALGFRDVTAAAFPPGYATGNGHYEEEMGDFEGDGDLDILGVNWKAAGISFNDVTLAGNGDGTFATAVVLPGSGADDNEGGFFDYDEDGDLDVFMANFSGQERAYRNDGPGVWTLMPTGTVFPPDTTTSLDADAADVDADGDVDLFVANDSGQPEWYLQNTTSADDLTPPWVFLLEQAPDRAAGFEPTVVRVQVYDNAPYYTVWYQPVALEVRVDAGPVQTLPMRSSAGQVFRGEIPGSIVGTVAYRVVASDEYGNSTTTALKSYVASGAQPGVNFCEPGKSAVIACPCANPPAAAGRGCDNSSATGGAQLSSAGRASLSFDSLVLSAAGEKPTATTIFLQGDATAAGGVVFGQGVRCVAGALKRLYVKTAAGGAASAPGLPDPTISARSAALGDPIAAGQQRHYMTYYRDPVVLGGCPATSTFNATQAQSISWSP